MMRTLEILLISNSMVPSAAGCMHSRMRHGQQQSEMEMINKVRERCELDAMLCQNELSFASVSFPAVIPSAPVLVQKSNENVLKTDPMLDQMLNDLISFSMEAMPLKVKPSTTTVIIEEPSIDSMEKVMDDMLSSFFQSSPIFTSSPDTMTFYIEQIGNHGRRLLEEEPQNPTRERLARRLSSVHNHHHHHMHHDHHHAPSSPRTIFTKDIDQCLYKRAFEKTVLSSECGRLFENMRSSRSAHHGYGHDYYHSAHEIVSFSTFFIFLFTTLFLLKMLFLKSNANRRRHLKRSILRAVFLNRELRERVEEEVGEEIGHLSKYFKRRPSCMDRFCFSLPFCSLTILLCYVSLTSPGVVILVGAPVVMLLGLYAMIKMCFCTQDDEEEEDEEHDEDEPNYVRRSDEAVYVAVPAVI